MSSVDGLSASGNSFLARSAWADSLSSGDVLSNVLDQASQSLANFLRVSLSA
jgi:hypothetical protein